MLLEERGTLYVPQKHCSSQCMLTVLVRNQGCSGFSGAGNHGVAVFDSELTLVTAFRYILLLPDFHDPMRLQPTTQHAIVCMAQTLLAPANQKDFQSVDQDGLPWKASFLKALPSTVPRYEVEAMLLLCLITWSLKEDKMLNPGRVICCSLHALLGLFARMPAAVNLFLGQALYSA